MRHAPKRLNHRTPHKSHLFSIPLFLFSSLSFFISFRFFSSRSCALSLDPSFSSPALPCRSGQSWAQVQRELPGPATRTFEKPVSKPGIPRQDRRSLVTWVILFLSRRRRSGISAARRRRRRGSRDDILVVPGVSPMNRSRVYTRARA